MDSHLIHTFASAMCLGLVLLLTTVDFSVKSQGFPYEIQDFQFRSFSDNPIAGTSIQLECFTDFKEPVVFIYEDIDLFLQQIQISFHRDKIPFTRNRITISEDFVNRTTVLNFDRCN